MSSQKLQKIAWCAQNTGSSIIQIIYFLRAVVRQREQISADLGSFVCILLLS